MNKQKVYPDLIAGHLVVSYQPEAIGHEVDPQGFNCDLDDHSYIPRNKVRRKRGKKKNQASPGEDRYGGRMMQSTSRLMSLMVPAE